MARKPNAAIWLWVAAGFLGYLLLPWYAIQDTAWYEALPQVFGAAEGANGPHAGAHAGARLALRRAGRLVLCTVGGLQRPGRGQGRWLLAGGLIGALGLIASGFLIGARGWSVAAFSGAFGELAVNQFGIGAAAASSPSSRWRCCWRSGWRVWASSRATCSSRAR